MLPILMDGNDETRLEKRVDMHQVGITKQSCSTNYDFNRSIRIKLKGQI